MKVQIIHIFQNAPQTPCQLAPPFIINKHIHPSEICNPKYHCYLNSLIQALPPLFGTISYNFQFKSSTEGSLSQRYSKQHIQYIPRNMQTVFALLCFVVVIHWLIFPYPSGLLHWHCGNLTIAPVPAKQPWWIWINTSCEFIMNDCITTTKQGTAKPCAHFLGYTVVHPILRIWMSSNFNLYNMMSSMMGKFNNVVRKVFWCLQKWLIRAQYLTVVLVIIIAPGFLCLISYFHLCKKNILSVMYVDCDIPDLSLVVCYTLHLRMPLQFRD